MSSIEARQKSGPLRDRRFLMIHVPVESMPRNFRVILNWFTVLQDKADGEKRYTAAQAISGCGCTAPRCQFKSFSTADPESLRIKDMASSTISRWCR